MAAHATLGASKAHRWARCPASVRACEDIPDTAGQAAADGTLGHEWAAGRLALYLIDRSVSPVILIPDEWKPYLNEYVDYCVSLVRGPQDFAYVEQNVPIEVVTGTAGDEGTADFVCLQCDDNAAPTRLHVVDLKFGEGDLVFSEDAREADLRLNPQLAMYAGGVIERFSWLLPNDDAFPVVLHIHQPRRDHVSTIGATVGEVRAVNEYLATRAALTRSPLAPFVPGVKQCHFCPIRGSCRARQEMVQQDFTEGTVANVPPAEVSDDSLAEFAAKIPHFTQLAKHVMEEIGRRVRNGGSPGGFKFVRGKSNRVFTAAAPETLVTWFGRSKAYTTPEPELIGIGAAESLLRETFPVLKKKERDAMMVPITHKPDGKLKLVGPDHPGQAVQVDPSSDFTESTDTDESDY